MKVENIRWGMCCIFRDAPIKYSTTTVSYFAKLKAKQQDPLIFIDKIIQSNLQALQQTIAFCSEKGIGAFRINSEFLPIFCHLEHKYKLDQLPNAAQIFSQFNACKKHAKEKNIRLSFHPDHFVVLSSPHPHVVQNSIRELEYHGEIAELLGADVINIHVGGSYGNKKEALDQFSKNFNQLSQVVKSRLTIENDDRSYSPQDLLPLCHSLNIPLVYDVHHHRCLPDQIPIEDASDLAFETWNREPFFHLSSPVGGWQGLNPRKHHDFIDIQDFPLHWLKYSTLTIDIEAKYKEIAVLKIIADMKRNEALF
jgi:UV DNA damage endonuclease